MNAKRPEPTPIRLEDPPTDIEIAEALDAVKIVRLETVDLLIRRLAFQLDRHVNKTTYIERPTSPPPPRKKS